MNQLDKAGLLRETTQADLDLISYGQTFGWNEGKDGYNIKDRRVNHDVVIYDIELALAHRGFDGPVPKWILVERVGRFPVLFVTPDYYQKPSKRLARVDSQQLAQELLHRIKNTQKMTVTADTIAIEDHSYRPTGTDKLTRELLSEDGQLQTLSYDTDIKHWPILHPRIFGVTKLQPEFEKLHREIGFEIVQTNDPFGFRLTLPRATTLNKKLRTWGKDFSHLNFVEVHFKRIIEPSGFLVHWPSESNLEYWQSLAQGKFPIYVDNWDVVSMYRQMVGGLLLPPSVLAWHQQLAKALLTRWKRAKDPKRKELEFYMATMGERLVEIAQSLEKFSYLDTARSEDGFFYWLRYNRETMLASAQKIPKFLKENGEPEDLSSGITEGNEDPYGRNLRAKDRKIFLKFQAEVFQRLELLKGLDF